ncbi:hypothetical protein H261_00010 [Paramagnetospirillum caucaseum]|uniref:Uncharacterized protein n=1 Tax=Paramagnetospirillum caucaseum TaxID=1244869 RepID=M2ZBU8_9PROT|nr:hypothetical protein H261_00010 [Paramagnetospirillum caucaseum]
MTHAKQVGGLLIGHLHAALPFRQFSALKRTLLVTESFKMNAINRRIAILIPLDRQSVFRHSGP